MFNKFCIVLAAAFFVSVSGYCMDNPKNAPKKTTVQEANSSEQPIVTFVELGSVNCMPCKAMQPVMKEVEKDYGDQVKVVFYDVWTAEGQPYAKQYKIMAIPTQVFLDKDGKEYFRHTGFYPKVEIDKVLQKQGLKIISAKEIK